MNAQVQENQFTSDNFDLLETISMSDDQKEIIFNELEIENYIEKNYNSDEEIQLFSDELMDEMITFYN